jgi:RNA polymerase sigma-70 factor (ECF subfamily)
MSHSAGAYRKAGSSPAARSRSVGSYWRTATGCSARSMRQKTSSRRHTYAHGGPIAVSRAGRRCASGSTGSRPTSACPPSGTAAERALPSGLGGPGEDSARPASAAAPDIRWLQPIPDALVTPESEDPAVIVAGREGLRLALIASLQRLPARQRAVLILREVLAFPAAEVAAMLDTSTAAVKSLLQRARARLDQVASASEQIDEPAAPELRELLDQYIAAFENADVTAVEQVLRKDAALEVVPSGTWVARREDCLRIIREALGSPGDWRMLPTTANRQPAAAAYLRDADGTHRAFGIAVLTTTSTGIARIVVFGEPDLVTSFGLPPVHPARTSSGA